jgi:hypothetical protein
MKSDDCCAATEATTTAAVAPADRVAPAHRARSSPVVEVLYFDGCPNHEPSVALVERVAKELGLQPEIRLVNVTDAAAAARLRFLGSPTVRVDGRDIEPDAEQRTDFVLSCRVFRTESGFSGEPDERWVRDALLRERAVSAEISAARPLEASPPIAAALAATGIPPERLGASRSARLSTAERALYLWILRRFATEGLPAAEAIRTKAAELRLGLEQVCEKLAAEDLVHFDPVGEVVVAYPFSGRPRGHRVLIDGLRWVEAMCAIDALGIAPMLGLPIEITSRDPVSGGEVSVRLDPGDGVWWEPKQAVVLAGSACCDGPSFGGCCDVLNFFESEQNAERYLREHEQISGFPISIAAASELGRSVFGDIFKEG